MTAELIGALCGAIVAFGGTYLLQRTQFRRAELDQMRQQVGLTRALRADLRAARMLLEMAVANESFPSGTRFPVEVWASHGHRLIALVDEEAEAALIEAFSRLGIANGLLAGNTLLFSKKGDRPDIDMIQQMLGKLAHAIEHLDALEERCELSEARLLHPVATKVRRVDTNWWPSSPTR